MFNTTYDTGRNVSSAIGYFKVAERDGETRYACVAAKKATKSSVDRTRIRRRGYTAIERALTSFPPGYGIIWFLPPEALTTEFSDLELCVKTLAESLSNV